MYRFPTDPNEPPGRTYPRGARVPDLPSQFEALLDAVWTAEENWRFDDRLDLALGDSRAA